MKTFPAFLLLFITNVSVSQDTLKSPSPAEREAIIVNHLDATLDKWYLEGTPDAYARPFAPEITYFDPGTTHAKIRTKEQLAKLIGGRNTKGDYSEVQHTFQHYDNVTVHTLNYQEKHSGIGWNGTEVYRWRGSDWEIIHAHWSFKDPFVIVKDFEKYKRIGLYSVIPGIVIFFLAGWFIGSRTSKKSRGSGV